MRDERRATSKCIKVSFGEMQLILIINVLPQWKYRTIGFLSIDKNKRTYIAVYIPAKKGIQNCLRKHIPYTDDQTSTYKKFD